MFIYHLKYLLIILIIVIIITLMSRWWSLFAVPVVLTLISISAEASEVIYKPKLRNNTRTWANVFQGGFIESSLKYSNQGKLDCT